MRTELERYDLIQRYLTGDLAESELSDFERALAVDPDLKDEVEAHRFANELAISQGLLELEEKVMSLDFDALEKDASEANATPSSHKWLGAFTLLLGIGLALGWPSPKISTQEDQVVSQESTSPVLPTLPEARVADPEPLKGPQEDLFSTGYNKHHPVAPSTTLDHPDITLVETPTMEESQNQSEKTSNDVAHEEPEAPPTFETDSPEEPTDPCRLFAVTIDLVTEDACEGEMNGAWSVQRIEGGTAPYTLTFQTESYSDEMEAQNVAPGIYQLYISDAQGCQTSKEFVIKEVECEVQLPKDGAISPQLGQTFPWPLSTDEEGQVRLFNSAGTRIYEARVTQLNPWDGTDNQGNTLPSDAYTYLLKLDSGKIIKGTVTIVNF